MELKLPSCWELIISTACSNCTFMELKSTEVVADCRQRGVLIVPLWNWNREEWKMECRGMDVLIVPLWNWNIGGTYCKTSLKESSNCTFMELKYLGRKHVTMRKVSSNCTFMELKFLTKAATQVSVSAFIPCIIQKSSNSWLN